MNIEEVNRGSDDGGESKGVDEDYDMKGIEKRKAIANIIKLKNESFKTTLFEATIALLNVVGKLKEISEKISEMTSETTSEMGSFLLLFKTTAAEALLKGVAKLDVIVEQYENEIETHNQDLINLLSN